ncbi:uncharacterized protein A1O5_06988 [Cladophialophora psammophila CBS 110553]|uniref:Uncharacterized protein n=1 Tax=Cladophialophora psammophila CBS 110553 TaxID=1182543 RepID=W9WXZ8_9EURO|nr:uncharacterized protein A1O5_06988 [Cladophialophora psammophila CBS 110553]EXJ69915.1 hypothetical protein A1O5_06988 [Cladophialophora psammophila CBS 110553]
MSLTMQRYLPQPWEAMSNNMLAKIQNTSFKLKPEWRINPAPSLVHNVPTVTDTLIPGLEKGEIQSVEIAERITGEFAVELANGKVVEVDTIIWCTGYHVDYSVVGDFDPTLETCHTGVSEGALEVMSTPPIKDPASKLKQFEPPIPRLYQNLLSLSHPDSLAFLGTAAIPSAAFQIYDLATMAIAQLWKPDDSSPDWLDETSGCRVDKHLGYGRTGWAFWLNNREFCNSLMDGIYSPHVYRLFDSHGKQKAWASAKEAIIGANEEAERRRKDRVQRKQKD